MCSLSYPATQSNKHSFETTFRVLCFVCFQQTHVQITAENTPRVTRKMPALRVTAPTTMI